MSFLEVQGLKKIFPGAPGKADTAVFDDVNFGIERGEFVCIIGHSGCGKTTILNVLAGLEQPTSGLAIMDNREIARALGRSDGATKVLIHRAIKQLQEEMSDE